MIVMYNGNYVVAAYNPTTFDVIKLETPTVILYILAKHGITLKLQINKSTVLFLTLAPGLRTNITINGASRFQKP